ncbi:MAG: hypothetical protein IKP49_01260 [Treponema sp.]|nr:hypothetical protein [Treponema sp.]
MGKSQTVLVQTGTFHSENGASMIGRKIEPQITNWIKNGKNALLVTGASQTAKTKQPVSRISRREAGCALWASYKLLLSLLL